MTATPFSEIPVSNRSTYGQQLLQAVTNLQSVITTLNMLDAKAATMITNNGDGTNNYNQIETQFGLTHTGVDTASVGYSLKYQLDAVISKLADAAISQFLAQVG